MTDLIYILFSILMLIGLLGLVCLKGKALQAVFGGTKEATKEKGKKQDFINTLISSDISAIDINQASKLVRVSDRKAIETFKKSLENNKICKLSKKDRLEGPTFQIYISGNKHIFESYLSPAYEEDVFIRLWDKHDKYYIKFHSLKHWLNEIVLINQK